MSAATTWTLIGGCAAITAVLKGAGPIALGGRTLPPWFSSIVALMAPALFAALVVTQVLADGRELGVGADTAGVALAGVAAWRGASVITVVFVAAVTAAALRALA
ncbi:MAG TPA: AzlD domain-containing protein [Solirubrobacteraceae bacterium]|nr:AzlD domain-containing protein [Solirubrobacteraceae bacterium]